jgi:hypothetical protein
MNPLTVAQFRADFPEFADRTKYPDALITQWIAVAQNLVNPSRWGALLLTGQELVTAHFVVLAVRDRAAAQSGELPGTAPGLATAQAAGPVSASYDYSLLLSAEAGSWNQTSYGQRFYKFLRLLGAGPVQLPGCCC